MRPQDLTEALHRPTRQHRPRSPERFHAVSQLSKCLRPGLCARRQAHRQISRSLERPNFGGCGSAPVRTPAAGAVVIFWLIFCVSKYHQPFRSACFTTALAGCALHRGAPTLPDSTEQEMICINLRAAPRTNMPMIRLILSASASVSAGVCGTPLYLWFSLAAMLPKPPWSKVNNTRPTLETILTQGNIPCSISRTEPSMKSKSETAPS